MRDAAFPGQCLRCFPGRALRVRDRRFRWYAVLLIPPLPVRCPAASSITFTLMLPGQHQSEGDVVTGGMSGVTGGMSGTDAAAGIQEDRNLHYGKSLGLHG